MAKRWIDTACKCASEYVCKMHQSKKIKRTKSQMIMQVLKRYNHYSEKFFELNRKGHFKEAGKALRNMWRMYDIITRNRTHANHKETR